jgi:hypothetical protein
LGEEWLLAVGFGACDGMVGVLLQCELNCSFSIWNLSSWEKN